MSGRSGLRGWLLPAGWMVALAAVRAGLLDERDPLWQVRAGVENLAGAPLRRADTWSWDPVAGLFTQTSPGWNDVLALGWQAAGFAGFFAIAFLSILAYGLIALALARRVGGRPLPTLLAVLATLLLALPMLSPRATLAAQTLFLGVLLLVDTLRPALARVPLAAAAGAAVIGGFGLGWLGSWIHLSWTLLAPALWAALVVLLLATPGLTTRRTVLLGAGAGAGLACGLLAGPYGLDAWEISREVQSAVDGVVLEWLPPWTPGLWPRWLPAIVVALCGSALAAGWVARRWRVRLTDPRVGLTGAMLVLAAPAAVGGLLGIRFIGISLLGLAPLAGAAATALADRAHRRAAAAHPTGVFRHERVRFWTGGRPWQVVLTAVLVLLSPLALLAASNLGRPASEAEAADRLPRDCRLISDPSDAGTVLLVRPDVRVWFDTRADYWGRERNLEALRTLSSGDTTRHGVAAASCAMLPTDGSRRTGPLRAALDADRSWRRTWSGAGFTVWVRLPA